jgi:hypothetical protein
MLIPIKVDAGRFKNVDRGVRNFRPNSIAGQ